MLWGQAINPHMIGWTPGPTNNGAASFCFDFLVTVVFKSLRTVFSNKYYYSPAPWFGAKLGSHKELHGDKELIPQPE